MVAKTSLLATLLLSLSTAVLGRSGVAYSVYADDECHHLLQNITVSDCVARNHTIGLIKLHSIPNTACEIQVTEGDRCAGRLGVEVYSVGECFKVSLSRSNSRCACPVDY
ncbi:hypothetical protein VTN77DRAFT_8477 [Rasamsonia byssochlamydoides]|uniref:uncharacterized protein n=1 Tax=Rasamsonia byssochlamydoides TaxID=89139 RepID=UPI0037431BED